MKFSTRNLLLCCTSATALLALGAPALAQEQTMETVVVTGIRASLQSAQSIKQNSDQVVDAITAVDIGALPDRNVADALQRVPGVTLTRTNNGTDPVRFGGTGSQVLIRGLTYTQAETNGRAVFSATNGQGLSWSDVSADLLSGVDIYKNPDAKQIEGGIGGIVNLKTRKPFDQDGRMIAVTGDLTYAEFNKRGTPSVAGLYSDRWNTSIGEMGLLISADWQNQRNRTNGINLGNFGPTTSGGQTYYLPNGLGTRQLDWQQQRFATDAVFQWRPNGGKWEITVEALNAIANPNDTEHFVSTSEDTSSSAITNSALGYHFTNGMWDAGKINVGWLGNDTRVSRTHDRTTDVSLNVKYNPTDDWSFSADAQFVESVATYYGLTAQLQLGGYPTQQITVDLRGDSPYMNTNTPSALSTKANWNYMAMMSTIEDNVAHSGAFRLDGSHTFGGDGALGWLKSVDFGGRFDDKLSITRNAGYNWGSIGATWDGASNTVWLTNTALAANAVQLYDTHYILGHSQLPAMWYPTVGSLKTFETAWDAVKNAKTIGWGWQPYSVTYSSCAGQPDVKCMAAYAGTKANGGVDHGTGGINPIDQQTIAGYVQANFANDQALGIPVDGNFGVRVVQTRDQIAAGYLSIGSIQQHCKVGQTYGTGNPAVTTCADIQSAAAFMGGSPDATGYYNIPSVSTPYPAITNTYTDVLPSFNITAHATDQIQVRFAYSQSIVRPTFSQQVNFQSVGFKFNGQNDVQGQPGSFDRTDIVGQGRDGTAGNPHLKPMYAQNYDGSFEWYFNSTGSLTAAVFYKAMGGYFFASPNLRAITNPTTGQTMNFVVTTTENGPHGRIKGFELAYQQFYDFLPGALSGLGLQLNYTKIWSDGGANNAYTVFQSNGVANSAAAGLPLEGISPDSYNIALLYEKYGFSGRMAYNWRSGFLYTTSASNTNEPAWAEKYGQLDGSLFYGFWDHYKIGIQVTNITNATTYEDAGFASFHPRTAWIDTDRKWSLVFRAHW